MVASAGQEAISLPAQKAGAIAHLPEAPLLPLRLSLFSRQQPPEMPLRPPPAALHPAEPALHPWLGRPPPPLDYEGLCISFRKAKESHGVCSSDATKPPLLSVGERCLGHGDGGPKLRPPAAANKPHTRAEEGDDDGASANTGFDGRQSSKRSWSADSAVEDELLLHGKHVHKRAECMVSERDSDDAAAAAAASVKESANDSDKNPETGKVFSCFFCTRKFYSSQALGGHQNAHKRERTASRKAAYPDPLLDQRYNSLTSLQDIDLISNLNQNLRREPRVSDGAPISLLMNGNETLSNRSLGIKAHSLIHNSLKMDSFYKGGPQLSPSHKPLIGVGKFQAPPLSFHLNARNIGLLDAQHEYSRPSLFNWNVLSSPRLNNSIVSSISCDQEDSLDLSLRL